MTTDQIVVTIEQRQDSITRAAEVLKAQLIPENQTGYCSVQCLYLNIHKDNVKYFLLVHMFTASSYISHIKGKGKQKHFSTCLVVTIMVLTVLSVGRTDSDSEFQT